MWETTEKQRRRESESEVELGKAWELTTECQGGELVKVVVLEIGVGGTPEPFWRHSTHWNGMQVRSPRETMFLYHRSWLESAYMAAFSPQ